MYINIVINVVTGGYLMRKFVSTEHSRILASGVVQMQAGTFVNALWFERIAQLKRQRTRQEIIDAAHARAETARLKRMLEDAK
jgi:hypothetical protein